MKEKLKYTTSTHIDIDPCDGCRIFMVSIEGPRTLCGFRTGYVYACPCTNCIIKSCCSTMCELRINKLDSILSDNKGIYASWKRN